MAVSDLESTTTTFFDVTGENKHKKRFCHPIFSFLAACYLEKYVESRYISPHSWTFLKSYPSFKNGVWKSPKPSQSRCQYVEVAVIRPKSLSLRQSRRHCAKVAVIFIRVVNIVTRAVAMETLRIRFFVTRCNNNIWTDKGWSKK